MNRKTQGLILFLSALGLVLIAIGGSLALFSYTQNGTTDNTIKSGSLTFLYDEENREGNGITIEDALPISDALGKAQVKAFNFKITSSVSSTTEIPYTITLRQKQGTDNIGNIVKVYLAKTADYTTPVANEEEVVTSLFSSLTDVTHNGYSEKLLLSTKVPAGSSDYVQNYRLKMWVDSNTNYSQVENETTHELEYPYNNKTFTATVNVYASGANASE